MQFILAVTSVREIWTVLCHTWFRTCQDAVCKSTDRHQAKPAAVSADMAARGGSNIVTNLLAAESWLHCLLQAYQLHRFARYVCVCVCVCVCVVFFQMSAWSVLLKNNDPTSCTFCVISAMDIGNVHGVPAWSSDMWWTLVAKLM